MDHPPPLKAKRDTCSSGLGQLRRVAIPSIETVRGWRGRVMVDRDSNKIGEVVDIYL